MCCHRCPSVVLLFQHWRDGYDERFLFPRPHTRAVEERIVSELSLQPAHVLAFVQPRIAVQLPIDCAVYLAAALEALALKLIQLAAKGVVLLVWLRSLSL